MSNQSNRTSRSGRDLRSEIAKIAHANPEQLVDGYLSRLRRLLRLRRDHFSDLNEQGLRLLDRSIFASYCDLLDIDQRDAAIAILKNVRLTTSLSQRPSRVVMVNEEKEVRKKKPRKNQKQRRLDLGLR